MLAYHTMARFVLACLVLVQILLVQAMAFRSDGLQLNPPRVLVQTGDESHVMADHAIAEPPSSSGEAESSSEGESESSTAQAPQIRRLGPLGKHHSSDKSVAGGGVIIGGLVTAIFAAVYCYIRVTRRRDGDKQ